MSGGGVVVVKSCGATERVVANFAIGGERGQQRNVIRFAEPRRIQLGTLTRRQNRQRAGTARHTYRGQPRGQLIRRERKSFQQVEGRLAAGDGQAAEPVHRCSWLFANASNVAAA